MICSYNNCSPHHSVGVTSAYLPGVAPVVGPSIIDVECCWVCVLHSFTVDESSSNWWLADDKSSSHQLDLSLCHFTSNFVCLPSAQLTVEYRCATLNTDVLWACSNENHAAPRTRCQNNRTASTCKSSREMFTTKKVEMHFNRTQFLQKIALRSVARESSQVSDAVLSWHPFDTP